jgi:hypothetical protein
MLALPAAAGAALAPPRILEAGFDAQDQLYVRWQLAPGTTLDTVAFATSPEASPNTPSLFNIDNFAGFGCAQPEPGCDSAATATEYRSEIRRSRDRRYFVKVTVKDARGKRATSPVWVIDAGKPLVPGRPAFSSKPTNQPVTGGPLAGSRAFVEDGKPTISIVAPATTTAIASRGLRVTVLCPRTRCEAALTLSFGGRTLLQRRVRMTRAGERTIVLRLSAPVQRQLGRLAQGRLTVRVVIRPRRGAAVRKAETITVVAPGTPAPTPPSPPDPPPPEPPGNRPPVFSNPFIGGQRVTEYHRDQFGNLTGATTEIAKSVATDPDGDPITYVWAATVGTVEDRGQETNAGIDQRIVRWTRGVDVAGFLLGGDVTITASDGKGGTDTFTFRFT